MVPSFIPVDLANKILVIGKSINFMRKCCNDTEWVLGVLGTSLEALFKRFMSAKTEEEEDEDEEEESV